MNHLLLSPRIPIVLVLIPAAILMPAAAQDWPQWRGPNRDDLIDSFLEPQTWPEHLKQQWQISVGTRHSSPVPANNSALAENIELAESS